MIRNLFITGANRGIGLEFVKQYAKEGWRIIACCRNPKKSEELQKIATQYPHVYIQQLDVTSWKRIDELSIEMKNEKIDLIINNAAIFKNDAFGSYDPLIFEDIYRTNAIAPLMICQAFMPCLTEGSAIVSITSGVASIASDNSRNLIAYRMSKVALNMGMQEIAKELNPRKIRVLLLSPGWVKTEMGGKNALLHVEESVQEMRQTISKNESLENAGFYNYNGTPIEW